MEPFYKWFALSPPPPPHCPPPLGCRRCCCCCFKKALIPISLILKRRYQRYITYLYTKLVKSAFRALRLAIQSWSCDCYSSPSKTNGFPLRIGFKKKHLCLNEVAESLSVAEKGVEQCLWETFIVKNAVKLFGLPSRNSIITVSGDAELALKNIEHRSSS